MLSLPGAGAGGRVRARGEGLALRGVRCGACPSCAQARRASRCPRRGRWTSRAAAGRACRRRARGTPGQ
eukprot:scaffold21037_cov24-Phaeocystis_antarctica.AAC.1